MFQEAYPILIGDLDPSGNLQANIIHAPSGNFFSTNGISSRFENYNLVLHRQPADKDDGCNHGGEVAECADDSRLQGWWRDAIQGLNFKLNIFGLPWSAFPLQNNSLEF